MENTCVLTILPVFPNWKIYNSVPKRPVKYCAILKEKREFQNLVESVVLSKNLKNSCSIIDKKIGASNDKNSLEIVFLNLEVKDLLCLNLSVNKKHALRRRTNLLIFLKNNANNLKYHIQDNSIYVKCDPNIQWLIFYNLFEFLLVRYGICTIGTKFYCALFSDWMLKQEIRFLCYNPIDATYNSYSLNLHPIATNINDKNLSHPCKKMPKRALCSQSCFSDTFVSTSSQDLTLKILSDSIPKTNTLGKECMSNCMMLKRKIPKLDCFCSELHCKCHESKWKIHKSIPKYNVSCYMDILMKKGVTSTDELSIAQGDSNFSSTFGSFSSQNFESSLSNVIENSNPSVELLATKRNDFPLSESQNGANYSPNHLPGDQYVNFTRSTVPVLTNSITRGELKPKPESLLKAINLLSGDVCEKENVSFLFDEFSEKKKCNSTTTALALSKSSSGGKDPLVEFSEKKPTNSSTIVFNMFQTASGNKVNISNTALKAAEKMFTEVMMSDEDSFNVDTSTNNQFVGNKFDPKKVMSSSVFESTSFPETGQDKHLTENIDEMLVDNFFGDICFDEKEEDSTNATQSSSMFTDNCEKSSSFGKVRKSLGGRRSLKPYSVPKS